MPDREKVIKELISRLALVKAHLVTDALKASFDRQEFERGAMLEDQRTISDAIALLKEQEPVKPVCDIDTWKCGKCGCKLEHQEMHGETLFHDIYDFCPHCGKAVKWDA